MTSPADTSSVAGILVTALRAAGVATGDAQARQGTTQLTGRYVVVWPSPQRPHWDQPMDREADYADEVQIMLVGPSRGAVDLLAVAVKAVINGPLAAPDGYVYRAPVELVVAQALERDKPADPLTPESAPFYRSVIYRFHLTPE